MVCTTALLCNNAWNDELLAEYKGAKAVTPEPVAIKNKCETCQAFVNKNSQRLQSSSQDDVQRVLSNVGKIVFIL